MRGRLFCSVCLALLLAGCNNSGNVPAVGSQEKKNVPAPEVSPPQAPAAVADAPAASASASALKGKVAETMNTAGYTYLLLETAQGPQWVAIPEAQVNVGEELECLTGMVMTRFHSQTLNRDFDSIVFSPGLAVGSGKPASPHGHMSPQTAGAPAPAGVKPEAGTFAAALQQERGGQQASPTPEGMEMMGSAGSLGAVVPFAQLQVDKADGPDARSVGEIFAGAAELGQKKVRVRGKVVKLSRMIMGKNWVHLQDGTGDPMANSHDLVFTTLAEPEQGQIVTLEGVLAVGRDFGYGYKYAVIVEDALVVGQ